MKSAEYYLKKAVDKFAETNNGFENFDDTKEMFPEMIKCLIASHISYAEQAVDECAEDAATFFTEFDN